jgi:hypothetical protein
MSADVLARLNTPALAGLILSASALVLVNDWRLSFAALAGQYALSALLLAQIVVVQVALVKALVGLLVVGIFVITGREANFGRLARSAPPHARFEFATNFPFRLLALVMGVVVAWYAALQPGLAPRNIPLAVTLASYALMVLGLLNLGLTEEPMNAGVGLLTTLIGFEMLYAVFEQSLAVAALLAAVEFGVALAVSYLALLRHAARERAEQQEVG